MNAPLDLLVFAPHPDDGEIGVGGTLARLARAGRRVGIADMTRGEWGTKGDPETRMREAARASTVLGLAARECLQLPDSRIVPDLATRAIVAECLRRLRPYVVLAPLPEDPHPDHRATTQLVRDALLVARLPKADLPLQAWSVRRLVYYSVHTGDRPSLLVDISEQLETKLSAMACYRSQFERPTLPEGYTYLATSDYIARTRANAAFYGQMGRVQAAEPLWLEWPPLVQDPLRCILGEDEA